MKNKTKMTRLTALCLVLILMLSALAGCGKTEDSKADTETTVATEAESQTEPKTESKTETQTKADSDAADDDGLYFIQQAVRKSPEWVTKLEAAKDAEQLIVVAGIGKTTAVITMHEKNSDGEWEQIISTPGFIGEDGLGDANINDCYTPVGTFTIDKAFGVADAPGCQMEYIKVDENYYWSGDPRKGKHFNELVNIKDVPDLDTKNSERITDYACPYQYVLNMGYNAECIEEKGYAFFFHCFDIADTYTGGCVAVPESIMVFIMQHIKPGCKITINTLENMGGKRG